VELIDGRAIAEEIRKNLRDINIKNDLCPSLAVILVGDDRDSMIYVGLKDKAAQSISGKAVLVQLPAEISRESLLAEINKLNADENIHGIILQLPLPAHLQNYQDEFLEAIKTDKDVDGFNPINRGKLISGQAEYVSCAALACMEVIDRYITCCAGKNVLLLGDSFDLILPLAVLLINNEYNVQVIQEYEAVYVKNADILIVEKGKAKMVKEEHLHDKMLVIDAGFHWDGRGVSGNVDKDFTAEIKSYLLPVPGGMGPLLIAKLMENVSKAAALRQE